MAEEKRFTRATWQIMEQILEVDNLEDALAGSLEIIVETLCSEAGAIWFLDTKTDRLSPLFHIGPVDISNITVGDTITFYDGEMKPYELPVAGVFRIYAGQEMVLAADQYEAYFGERLKHNTFYLRLNGADMSSLKEAVQAIDGVEEIAEVAETRALYQSLASVLNLIALMFVGIAGMMAYFILLNLVNMYINQKKRELTIMRVNGFTIREVDNYVLREMVVSTALGIALGLGAGTLLGYRVILLLEGTTVRFMRGIQWEAWLFAALITIVFAVVVNAAALRKVKYLKLTDVA